jgi:predicted nucleotidyltransferase
MDKKTRQIASDLKASISEKYPVIEMRIFGSRTRKKYSYDSDIDIFVCVPKINRVIEEDIFDKAYDFELKYDCIIDLLLFDDKIYSKAYSELPIYKNILKEGIVV